MSRDNRPAFLPNIYKMGGKTERLKLPETEDSSGDGNLGI